MAGETAGDDGSGGMITKIEAARVALQSGCRLVIADGREAHPLAALDAGARATWFVSHAEPHTARKRWIAGTLKPEGRITVDAGAARALARGTSLLPAGVTAVEGNFERGDPVIVFDEQGRELARGLIAYDSADAKRILGRQSGEIETILGYRGREEIIHRDDLVES